jgi:hypothetical protein
MSRMLAHLGLHAPHLSDQSAEGCRDGRSGALGFHHRIDEVDQDRPYVIPLTDELGVAFERDVEPWELIPIVEPYRKPGT